jgi:hypothetical protein
MTILLRDTVNETYTNASGDTLYHVLKGQFEAEQLVELSFKDATITSSSFLNSSIGALIEEYGTQTVKQRIRPTGMSPTQATLLRKYMESFRDARDKRHL